MAGTPWVTRSTGAGIGVTPQPGLSELAWGKGEVRRTGSRIAILAFGTVLHPALAAAARFDATVADMKFVKPLDRELVLQLARDHQALVTVEEGCTMGGAGSAVSEVLAESGVSIPVLHLGLPDAFVEHGDPSALLALCGLDAAGIGQSILERFGSLIPLLQVVRPAANA